MDAAIRLPMRFPDGWSTAARVVSFDGLADDREHLALRLGPAGPGPRSCASTASA